MVSGFQSQRGKNLGDFGPKRTVKPGAGCRRPALSAGVGPGDEHRRALEAELRRLGSQLGRVNQDVVRRLAIRVAHIGVVEGLGAEVKVVDAPVADLLARVSGAILLGAADVDVERIIFGRPVEERRAGRAYRLDDLRLLRVKNRQVAGNAAFDQRLDDDIRLVDSRPGALRERGCRSSRPAASSPRGRRGVPRLQSRRSAAQCQEEGRTGYQQRRRRRSQARG